MYKARAVSGGWGLIKSLKQSQGAYFQKPPSHRYRRSEAQIAPAASRPIKPQPRPLIGLIARGNNEKQF